VVEHILAPELCRSHGTPDDAVAGGVEAGERASKTLGLVRIFSSDTKAPSRKTSPVIDALSEGLPSVASVEKPGGGP
jgi:hypothetical protein